MLICGMAVCLGPVRAATEIAQGPGPVFVEAPEITAASAIAVDAKSGRILYRLNADEQRPVASTQKLLTGLLIVERGSLGEKITIEAYDTQVEPTKLNVKPGESYTRFHLLSALMVRSANDLAKALGRDLAGSEEAFGQLMTRKARALGAVNSRFQNASGLPAEDQYSTATDLVRIAIACYRNPTLRPILAMPQFLFEGGDGAQVMLINTNRVLHGDPLCNGMKTGFTRASGNCLVASGIWQDQEVIVVMLGSTQDKVWDETRHLLRWALGVPLPADAKLPKRRPTAK